MVSWHVFSTEQRSVAFIEGVAGGVTIRVVQAIVKKLPDIIDANPLKFAFGIAKLIIETKDVRQCYAY
jgi:hypothetical protein